MTDIENQSTVKDGNWLFYNVVLSKNSPEKCLQKLKWEYTLPEFWELKQVVEMMDSIEVAANKDHLLESKKK